MEMEKTLICPYCGERISMLLDLSEDGTQEYIEDCEVCCRPIVLVYTAENHELRTFSFQASGRASS